MIFNVELLDKLFKLENIVVLVEFKLDIDVVWVFNIPNILVLVEFKLFIDSVVLDDNELRLENIVVDVEFKLLVLNCLINYLNLLSLHILIN